MSKNKDKNPAPATVTDTTEPTSTPEPVPTTVEEVVPMSLVPRGSTAVATLDDVQTLMMEDAEEDLGFEKGDVALPFLRVLQSNSPQVKRQNAKYVEGAEDGFFYNTATSKVYDGQRGIHVIPVHFTRQATLWVPRNAGEQAGPSGGGFVREVPMAEAEALIKLCTKNEKKKDITPSTYHGPNGEPNGQLELVVAALYYLLIVDPDNAADGMFEAVAYPLTSTQMKKARQWNALIQNSRLPNPSGPGSYRPAMFGFVYKLTTVPESNAQGEWMGVKITQSLPLIRYESGTPVEKFPGAAQLYLAARDFKALVGQGQVKTRAEDLREDDGGTMSGTVEEESKSNDDMPF